MKSFTNKVAAITGAGSGMGRSLAVLLAKRGCHVAISDVHEANLAETAALAKAHGVKVTSKRVDVADRAAVYAWADEVVADHGKCNLIFNNAGVAYGSSVEGSEYPDAEWLMGINFWGVVYGTKAFLPHLRASGEGIGNRRVAAFSCRGKRFPEITEEKTHVVFQHEAADQSACRGRYRIVGVARVSRRGQRE